MFLKFRMKYAAILLVLIAVLVGYLTMLNVSAEETDSAAGIVGWLEIEPAGGAGGGSRLAITGHAFAPADAKGRYTLDVRSIGKGGISNSRQSGKFALSAGHPSQLSTTAINLQSGTRLEIELKLFAGDEQVFVVTAKSKAPAEARRL